MVPAMVQALNKYPDLELSQFFRSLRYIGTAGASLDTASAQRLESKLHPEAQISQIWGMTEVGVAFQMRYGCRDGTGSIGCLLPNYYVKLLDVHGTEITADDTPGELYVRGPGVLMEYKGIPDAKDGDGWFRTGDIVSVRAGMYYVVGRAKELIKVRGYVSLLPLSQRTSTNDSDFMTDGKSPPPKSKACSSNTPASPTQRSSASKRTAQLTNSKTNSCAPSSCAARPPPQRASQPTKSIDLRGINS